MQTVADAKPKQDRWKNCLEAALRQGSSLEDYITVIAAWQRQLKK